MSERFLSELKLCLSAKSYNGLEIVNKLSEDPFYADLYSADAGVWEGYTIKEHTLMVFDNFEEQFLIYKQLYSYDQLYSFDYWVFLKLLLVLHDIGKPIAIKNGNKKDQHTHTVRIIEQLMTKLEFTKHEISLAKSLLGHDAIGEMIKGLCSLDEALEKLHLVTKQAGIDLAYQFPLQAFYYSMDAAAYPGLRKRIFKMSHNVLLPDNILYFTLHKKILGKEIG